MYITFFVVEIKKGIQNTREQLTAELFFENKY